MARRKRYSSQFEAKVVLELLKEEKTVGELSAEYGVHPSLLTRWRAETLEKLPEVFEGTGSQEKIEAEYEKKIEDLYSEIGRVTAELSWLKKS